MTRCTGLHHSVVADGDRAIPADSILPFCRSPQSFLLETAIAGGPVARFRLHEEPFVVLSDPEMMHAVLSGNADDFEKGALYDIPRTTMGDGLVVADGEAWVRQHRVLAPLFAGPRIRRLVPLVSTLLDRRIANWEDLPDGAVVDLLESTQRLAFDVVSQGLLGIAGGALADEMFAALCAVTRTESVRLWYLARGLGAHGGRVGGFERSAMAVAEARLDELCFAVADERLAGGGQDDDLIAAMITSPAFSALASEDKRRLVRDQVATMLTSGFTSTGESMFWALHLLAQRPAACERIREETRGRAEAAGGGGRAVSATPESSPYLAAVLSETLRLYPAVWYIGRIPRRALRLNGEEIPAGTRMICSPYVLHRLPSLWPEAGEFRPERFFPESAAAIRPRSYLPFGTGMRACIGRGLALLEMTMTVSRVLARFDLELVSPDPVDVTASYSLQPGSRVLFRLWQRA